MYYGIKYIYVFMVLNIQKNIYQSQEEIGNVSSRMNYL